MAEKKKQEPLIFLINKITQIKQLVHIPLGRHAQILPFQKITSLRIIRTHKVSPLIFSPFSYDETGFSKGVKQRLNIHQT